MSTWETPPDTAPNLRVVLPGEVNGIDTVAAADDPTFVCVTSDSLVAVVAFSPEAGLREIARCEVAPATALIDVACSATPDGKTRVAAVGVSPLVFILELEGNDLRQVATVETPKSNDNRAVAAIAGGTLVAVGGQGGGVALLDLDRPRVVRHLDSPHTSALRSVISFDRTLVTAGQDRALVRWRGGEDIEEFEPELVLRDAHDGWIWDLARSCEDGRVWSVGGDGCLGLLQAEDAVRHVAFVPDHWLMSVCTLAPTQDQGGFVVAGDGAGVIRCWDDVTFREIVSMAAHGDEVNAVSASPGDEVVLSGSRDGSVVAMARATIEHEALLREFRSEWGSDSPTGVDRLGRQRIATFLASRIATFLDQPGASGHRAFLLSGPWGAGKTSLAQMTTEELSRESPGTVVAEVNAWSTIGRGIAWTEAIEAVVASYLARARRTSLRDWFRIRVSLLATLSRVAISSVFAVLIVLGLTLLFGSAYLRSTSADVWVAVGTMLAGLATLFTVLASSGQLRRLRRAENYRASRWETHEARDTVLIAARMLEVCMRVVKEPFFLVIDDLDRCVPEAVTDLLENVHCVLDSRGFEFSQPSCILVAADESWIRSSFEHVYPSMATQDADFGSTIGSRFLEKLFYLVLPTGRLSSVAEDDYLAYLVEGANGSPASGHIIFGFRDLLPDNPRTVRRIVVAFEGLRELKTAENIAVPQATLMLWAIIRTRWPDAAIALAADPTALNDPSAASARLRDWLALPEVKRVLGWPVGGPLRPDDIRRCASEV